MYVFSGKVLSPFYFAYIPCNLDFFLYSVVVCRHAEFTLFVLCLFSFYISLAINKIHHCPLNFSPVPGIDQSLVDSILSV